MEHITVPAQVLAQAAVAGVVCYTSPSGGSYVVVQHDAGHCAFVNRCPHRRFPLDRNGRLTVSPDQRFLICRHHGAKFDRLSGRCVAGPCVGKALQPVTVLAEARQDGYDAE